MPSCFQDNKNPAGKWLSEPPALLWASSHCLVRSYHGPYRTAQPDSLRHRRLRMTGTEPHAPRGTAGRGPNWDRGPRADHAGAVRCCTKQHRRLWALPGPLAVHEPRELRVDACTSRRRRPRDQSWDRGLRAGHSGLRAGHSTSTWPFRVTQLLRPARRPRSPCGSRGRQCQGGHA